MSFDASLISQKKILLAGDLMLDHYTFGAVERISPEAPVPILHVQRDEIRPGGAGNAILNIKTLGIKVSALGRVGNDETGRQLIKLLQGEDVEVSGVVVDPHYITPRKNRIIASQQQLIRIDYEKFAPLPPELEKALIEKLPSLLEGVDTVALSDYDKGFLTPTFIQALILEARSRNIPVIIDPKGRDFSKYRGATLIKPNLAEAIFASGLSANHLLDEIAEAITSKAEIDHLLITRSEKGISLFSQAKRFDFPANVREVKDVTGAGDTVLAVMAMALATNLSLENGAKLANIAAGLAVEHVGCARITLKEIEAYL